MSCATFWGRMAVVSADAWDSSLQRAIRSQYYRCHSRRLRCVKVCLNDDDIDFSYSARVRSRMAERPGAKRLGRTMTLLCSGTELYLGNPVACCVFPISSVGAHG